MKKIGLLSLLSLIGLAAFAAFPVEVSETLAPEKFKLDTTAFLIGILTSWLFPYALLLLFVKKRNFKGSLAWGWLAGWVLLILFALLIFVGPEFMFLY
jgi:hypothetical protein